MSLVMDGLIEKRINLAQLGRKIWLRLVKEYDITDRTYVILLPSCEEDKLMYIMDAIDKLISLKVPDKVIVISEKSGNEYKKHSIVEFISCTEEEISAIVCLYSMYRFTPNLVVASLTKPDGRMGIGMMKKGSMDMKELFNMVSFGF